MKETIDYIVQNDLYDEIIYSSDGDDITPGHMKYIKEGQYTVVHNGLIEREISSTPRFPKISSEIMRIVHIQTASRAIEIWICEDIFKQSMRDIKINMILC